MKESWLRKCIGLELSSLGEGRFYARSCTLLQQKDTVSIVEKFEQTGTLKDVVEKVNKGLPLAVTLCGRDVLTKCSDTLCGNLEEHFCSVFPGLKSEDFYVMQFASGKFSAISIVRRTLIDNLISQLREFGFQPVIISIGPFVLSHVIQQLNVYNGRVVIQGHQINYEQKSGDWTGYQFTAGLVNEFPVKIGISTIEENMVIAYASAFQLLLYHRLSPVCLHIEDVSEILSELEEKYRFISRLSWSAAIAFVFLFVNFFVLSQVIEKNTELQAGRQRREKSIDNIAEVRRGVTNNEELLIGMAVRKGYRKAVMIDQLRATVPPAVRFEHLGINSGRDVKIPGKEAGGGTGLIQITASTKAPASANVWISALRDLSWVKNARISDFSAGGDDDLQYFTVLINY